MEIIRYILMLVKKNMVLFLILTIASIAAGIGHYSVQKITYSSQFDISNHMDYELFKIMMDFENMTSSSFEGENGDFEEKRSKLEDFRVSYVKGSERSIHFTLSSEKSDAGAHLACQDAVLSLINSNKNLKRANNADTEAWTLKRDFLDQRISDLDTMARTPGAMENVSEYQKTMYDLYAARVDVDSYIQNLNNFQLLKGTDEPKKNKRPIYLFVFLYLILGGILFFLFSKKSQPKEAE